TEHRTHRPSESTKPMDRSTITKHDGPSTAMMLTVIAALMLLFAAAVTLTQVHVPASRSAVAADLAVLSAADAARGLMIGEPCAVAESTIIEHGASMTACKIEAPGVAYVEVILSAQIGLDATA